MLRSPAAAPAGHRRLCLYFPGVVDRAPSLDDSPSPSFSNIAAVFGGAENSLLTAATVSLKKRPQDRSSFDGIAQRSAPAIRQNNKLDSFIQTGSGGRGRLLP